jgi:hypothetical protein
MDVGGEVVEGEAEPDSDVRVVEVRERFESWAETFGSTDVDSDLVKVGEDHPLMESRLPMPDLYEPLTALMEPASEGERCGFDGVSTWVVMIGARSSGSNEIGGVSQCMRKFSPRTELYGLQGLLRYKWQRKRTVNGRSSRSEEQTVRCVEYLLKRRNVERRACAREDPHGH